MITQTCTPVDGYELITLAEAKAHLRLDEYGPDEDTLLTQCIAAAINAAENYIERTINSEVLVLGSNVYQDVFSVSDWRKCRLTGIEALLPNTVEYATIAPELYSFYSVETMIRFKAPFAVADVTDALKITLLCEPPFAVKQACLLLMANFYEVREDRGENLNNTSTRLLRPYRKY